MATRPKSYYTPQEYLALERAAAYKSEYLDGAIFPMAGASKAHNTITLNIGAELRSRFRGRDCWAYTSDMRVGAKANGLYTYPDAVAVCGQEAFADDTLLNPMVVFEVLSPSTEGYDRGGKFARYQRIASLTDYVLVEQDQVRVEHFTRQGDGWFLRVFTALNQSLHLDSIGTVLPLAAIYEAVAFPADPPAAPDSTQNTM